MAIISLVAIVLTHLFVVSKLIFFPYPELFIYPYLTNIGLTPYAQIFDQHFPGVMFLPLNLGNMGFYTTEAMLALHISVIVINHLLLFFIVKKLLKDIRFALVANLFYALWHPYMEGYMLWIDSFMPVLLLPAFYFFVQAKKKKVHYFYISAIFLGLALVFKQVVLPIITLLAVYIWVVTQDFKKGFKFGLIAGIPMALVSFYYLQLGNFSDFFYWTVTFNVTIFSEMGRKYASFTEIIKMIAIFGPGLLYAVFNLKKRKTFILTLFVIGSLIFAYARFDFVHVQPALAFLAVLMAFLVKSLPKYSRNTLIIVYILIALIPINTRLNELKGDTIVFFTDYEERIIEEVREYSDDGDSVFAFATFPHLYAMTKTRPPGDVFVFHFPWFFVEAEERILEGLENDPPKIVIQNTKATTSGMNLTDSAPRIGEYIRQNYTLHDKIGDTEILLPNEENSN